MSGHRTPSSRSRGRVGHREQAAPAPPPVPTPTHPVQPVAHPVRPVAPGAGELRRHRAEVARDDRAERRLTWRELGCLLFVAAFLLLRARYLS